MEKNARCPESKDTLRSNASNSHPATELFYNSQRMTQECLRSGWDLAFRSITWFADVSRMLLDRQEFLWGVAIGGSKHVDACDCPGNDGNAFGKKAMVVNADDAVGVSICKVLRDLGFVVFATRKQSRHPSRERSVLQVSKEEGLIFIGCDVFDHEQCDALAEMVVDRYGGLDLLINCPAPNSTLYDTMTDRDPARLDVIGDDLDRTFNMTRAFVNDMVSRKSGHIVNLVKAMPSSAMASMDTGHTGRRGAKNQAGRAAVIAFSRSLANQLADSGVSINTLSISSLPSLPVDQTVSRPEAQMPKVMQEWMSNFGGTEPEQRVAHAVVFFAGPDGPQISGCDIRLN